MKVKIRDLTIQQWRMVCAKSFCTTCQLHDFCILESNDGLDEEINVPDEEEIKRAKKTLIECGIMTEDGKIAEAYSDIIVKKEQK